MATSSDSSSIDVLLEWTPWLWVTAVLFFGIGDLVTTVIGLYMNWAVEAGPLAAALIDRFGLEVVVALKTGAFALFYGIFKVTPPPYHVGVPLGLTVLGTEVTFWNLIVVFYAIS